MHSSVVVVLSAVVAVVIAVVVALQEVLFIRTSIIVI